jgi:adenine phosphoribosyltransferase
MKRIYDLDSAIRKVPDFPKPGILFYDISSLIAEPEAFRAALDGLEKHCRRMGADRALAAIEARGFVFGGALADRLGLSPRWCARRGSSPGAPWGPPINWNRLGRDRDPRARTFPSASAWSWWTTSSPPAEPLPPPPVSSRTTASSWRGSVGVVGLPFLDYEKALAGMDVAVLLEYFGE